MRGRDWCWLLALLVAHAAAAAPGMTSARALQQALQRAGRAEASLRATLPDASRDGERTVRATLALEPPERIRLEMAGGESIVLRADGGEWSQPALHQVVVFRAEHAAGPLRWWRVLLGLEPHVRERAASGGFLLTLLDAHGAPTDSAHVWLDAHGLPARIEVATGGEGREVYRLSGWRFTHARGESAFRLATPAGFERVELP